LFQFVFGMSDASASAHDLNVSRFYSPLVAKTISVSDCTLTDMGDDFDIGCTCSAKLALGAISSSFQIRKATPATSRWIMLRGKGKVMPGFWPTEIFAWELVEGPAFDHPRPQQLTAKGSGYRPAIS
jgi:hypothetical protein